MFERKYEQLDKFMLFALMAMAGSLGVMLILLTLTAVILFVQWLTS